MLSVETNNYKFMQNSLVVTTGIKAELIYSVIKLKNYVQKSNHVFQNNNVCNSKIISWVAGHLMTMTPEQLQAYRWEREIDERNRPLTDDELDSMFPPGYKVLTPPAGQ